MTNKQAADTEQKLSIEDKLRMKLSKYKPVISMLWNARKMLIDCERISVGFIIPRSDFPDP